MVWTSPSEVARTTSFSASMNWNTAACVGAFQLEAHDRADRDLAETARRMAAASGCAGSPGSRRARRPDEPASQRGDAAGVGALPLHAQRKRLDPAHGQVALKRSQHRADGSQTDCERFQDAAASETTTPPSTSPCPARYFGHAVRRRYSRRARAGAPGAAWRTCCPRLARRRRPWRFRRSRRSSPTRSRGFEIVSIRMQPGIVLGYRFLDAAKSHISTK